MRGDRIKKLRTAKKLTQEELGKIINVTKVSVSGYENGNRSPDTDTLQKLADILDTTTDYILGRTDNPNLINYNNEPEEKSSFSYNGEEIDLNKLNPDQRVLIDWALSHESLSFKDKPQDFYELLDLIRNIKPHVEALEKKKNK